MLCLKFVFVVKFSKDPKESPQRFFDDVEIQMELRVCCSVVQCGAVWCSVLQCGAVCCRVMQGVALCCVWICVCCLILQRFQEESSQHFADDERWGAGVETHFQEIS